MGYVEYPLRVPPSHALVAIIGFVWELEDSEVTSLHTDKEASHYLRFVAFPDYVMVLIEIQLSDRRARFRDLSGDDAVAFNQLVHRTVESSCAAFGENGKSKGRVLVNFEGQYEEASLEDVKIQSILLVRQVTGLQGSSTAVQLEAARTLARWAREPRRRQVIGYVMANLSDAISGFVTRSISAPRNIATLRANYPFLVALKSISACSSGASLLHFLQPLQSLVCIEDCSLLMSTFRTLLRHVNERAIQEEAAKVKDGCFFNTGPSPGRTHTSSTNYPCTSTGITSRIPTWGSADVA